MPEVNTTQAEEAGAVHDQQAVRYVDLAIYDEVLPSPASPFRTLEYGHYLSFFDRSALVSLEAWHHRFAHPGFGKMAETLAVPDVAKGKILPINQESNLVPRLAYVTFLNNAWALFPHFKERDLPFILQLYPGGGFAPNVAESDERLRTLLESPLCRRVIATQSLTRDYLLGPMGYAAEKIEMIYGGVFESHVEFDFTRDKKRFGTHKDTIDVCFVAYRYGPDTSQKGYDQFVEVARLLAPSDPRLRFHVVGGFRPEDEPLGEVADRFSFHGIQQGEFFAEFYPRMDVILSPNRPISGHAGPFDGFPTGACMEAGFRGVLNCIADPLSLNVAFEDGRDILIIDRDAPRTAERLRALFADPDRLYALAEANCRRFRHVFDINAQLMARTRIIVAELLKTEQLVIRPTAITSTAVANRIFSAFALAEDCERRLGNLVTEYRKLADAYEKSGADYALVAAALREEQALNARPLLVGTKRRIKRLVERVTGRSGQGGQR
jgi:glycosyltransferase involved in cell wall biosynthesis